MLRVGLADATQILKLTDEAVVDNLRVRYEADEIHTFVGSMLLILNPYRLLPIYDSLEKYRDVRLARAQPHVFAMAEEAYLCLRRDGVSQSLVISGESGAGKTESTKLLVRYVAFRARAAAGAPASALSESLVRSNPSLEAFGNASTTRNANSSRFAKFTRLHVGADGGLQRAVVVTYLLERSRVTLHAHGERNFHIFYLLLHAAAQPGSPWPAALELPAAAAPADFFYLRPAPLAGAGSGRSPPPPAVGAAGRSADAGPTDLATTLAVLHAAGVSAADASAVIAVVAAILHLGQAAFAPAAGGSDGAALCGGGATVDAARKLLGLADLRPLLLERRLSVPGADELVIQLTPQQCAGARDALSRALYELCFAFLVRAINRGLGGLVDDAPFIGLLDVFGFENFGTNSFEQLCINYANERLQQLLVERLFKAELKLYTVEGVPVPGGAAAASFADNLGCVEMFSASPSGIFRLLDSQCISPQATDAKFICSVNMTHSTSPFLRPPGARGVASSDTFIVKHYAGEVTYSGAGFVLKNADSLDSHCALALGNSSVPFVKALIEFGQQLAAGAAKAGKHGARRAGGLGLSGGSASASSLGRRFIGELDTLVKALSAGGCHFVRCVAPSGSGGIAGAALRSFDAGAVARQLRADGTFDAVRMLKHGYPVRVPFAQLHARFLPLLASASPQVEQLEPSQFGELLAAVVGVKPADCALGSTRIFLRGAAAIAFDELRAKDTAEVLPILTAKMAEWEAKRRAAKQLAPRLLGWHVRVLFQKKRRSAVALQARARGMHSRVRAMELQRARQAERLAVRRTEKAQAAAAAATTARARRRSTVDPQQERVASAALGELAEYVRAQQGGAIDFDRITEAGSQPSTRTATPRAPDGLAFGRAREAAVRQTLANRDYAMLENEMRTLVARQRAEDAAAQAGLTPRSHTNAYLTAEQRARAALSELDDDDDALIQRHALLRPPTSWIAAKAGSLELIVLEEGSALPVYRRMLKREEISRLRFVFDEWDMDHDGTVSLSEFFVVMQLLAGKASKTRTMHASSVEDMFNVADVNGDGYLDFSEFVLFSFGELTRSAGSKASSLVLHTSAAARLIGGGVGKTQPGAKPVPAAKALTPAKHAPPSKPAPGVATAKVQVASGGGFLSRK